ncbi:MAG: hypothetical protein MUF82_01270 [Bacteroidetes bacterium]|jgi:hypothetical protein|nr:hypothetical protein [Bacteroidota bacterium]
MAIANRRLALLFRVFIILLVLSTLNALRIFHFMPERFDAAFPGAVGSLRSAFLAASYIGLIALFGLLLFKRWALLTFLIVSLAAIVLDVLVDAPMLHQVAVVASASIAAAFSWRLRSRFSEH